MMNQPQNGVASTGHPMIARPTHDELSEQLFVRDLKVHLMTAIEPTQRAIAEDVATAFADTSSNDPVTELRGKMFEYQSFRTYMAVKRESQRQLWSVIGASVGRQAETLAALGDIAEPLGSVTVDEAFVAPAYITGADIHLMPGGNAFDDGSLLQGAVMDRGGAVYMLGRNGGMLNDLRGQTAMAHLLGLYPDVEPGRILDMGCGVGSSTVPAAMCFPNAEVHGIDVGASMMRYAHARAEHLGAAVHFSQQSAEHTKFPDGSFDVVFSCVLLHETSQAAVGNILAESKRLLRPGGVAIHLEVPLMNNFTALWDELSAVLESEFNNEPYWRGALSSDYGTLMRAAGFKDVQVGYQSTAIVARDAAKLFKPESDGVFRSWFVTSGRA